MLNLFNIKKVNSRGGCEAMRCPERPHADVDGHLWGRVQVTLCAKHIAMAADYAEKNEAPPSTALVPAVASAIEGPELASSWAERAREIVKEVQASKSHAAETLELVRKLTIASHSDMEDVAEYLREVKTFRDTVESKEKEITTPLNGLLRQFRALIAPAKQAWTEVEGLLRGMLSQAALDEAQRNRQIMDEAAQAHADGADGSAVVQQMTTSSDLHGVNVRFVWNVVVEDVSKLPDAYVTRSANILKLKEYAAGFEGAEPEALPGVKFVKEAPLRVQSLRGGVA
jgi:hypothetical protein